MKVRLTAEEYSRNASLRDRTPTHHADLLRRRVRVPLARCTGNRPRNSVRLRGQAVRAALARRGKTDACEGHAPAGTQACDRSPAQRESNGACGSHVCRAGCATRVRGRATALGSLPQLVSGNGEGA